MRVISENRKSKTAEDASKGRTAAVFLFRLIQYLSNARLKNPMVAIAVIAMPT